MMTQFLDIMLHLDKHLLEWIAYFGPMIYVVLFAVIFAETGLVIFPLLPGDSLLFAIGALAALDGENSLSLPLILGSLTVAAILGDGVNYHIGKYIGPKAFEKDGRFIKKKYLDETQDFYNRWGSLTIVVARFAPFVRTFAPFVAGVAKMDYKKFLLFNVLGGVLWVFSLVLAGYFFGNIPIIKNNFEIVVLGIVAISVLPIAIQMAKRIFGKKANSI
ncbi:MAG: VTT domain-containing protein [Bdellovibrionaceae bacterium]|nr:VTT domain-containing protein [Pseudobdellovibrionaceae bacterium]